MNIDAILHDLHAASEKLDSLIFDVLREASARGERDRPQVDKELVKVRRALDKAIHTLYGITDD